MSKPTDERLIAYLDGELDDGERAQIAHWLEQDGDLRQRAAELSESAAQLRAAFDEVLREPVPERLMAAAHGSAAAGATVVDLSAAREQRAKPRTRERRWWVAPAAAAAIAGVIVGIGISRSVLPEPTPVASVTPPPTFVENLGGYYRYATAATNEATSFDKLPQNFRLPDLKPWGLEFRGSRFIMIEGHEAQWLVYSTDNKALGSVMVFVGNSPDRADTGVTFGTSGNVNVLSWRSHGHTYAVTGTVDTHYLWNIHNDLAYQFDGI